MMDFVNANGQAQGEVGSRMMANNLNPGAMRPYIAFDKQGNALGAYVTVYTGGDPKKTTSYVTRPVQANASTLRRDEWKALDEAVIKVADDRMVGINDLRAKGLVYNLSNGMGSTVLESHSMSDAMEAEMSMDGITRGNNDRVTYGVTYLPLPIIHSDYQINARVLAASRNMGNALDTSAAERASRKVSEKLEDLLFTKPTTAYAFGGGTIYGYLNHPDRNQVVITSWTGSAKTAVGIVGDVLDMKQAAINAKHYGPYMLYIPTAYETKLDEDYDTSTPGTTIRERILKIAGIDGVKVADHMDSDNVVLVQMTSDVVRLVNGMGITNVEWKSEGNMVTNYKVMTIQVPQIFSDDDSNSGVVHGATK